MKKESISTLFGSMVFNDRVMKEKLPREVYKALKKTMVQGTHLELDVANVVANAMKDWALEKGATHFTHWFQPMTGVTAEKHDSFLTPVQDGQVIMDFSGSALVKGEPDASSFPSGGIRATFEARGYTVWDTTSYAFIKDETLCIPTAFCSYSGEALDKKTPLLRSMEAINKQALRILKLFDDETTQRVVATVGPEQEYFLIDKALHRKRLDLVCTGRTLFGVRPPKGQELDDHYFATIKPRVSAFMKDLERELWKLGVYAKTKHNEVAPGQYELAPVFTSTNIASDHNQLTMEIMKKVADEHNLVCLLHEKPFAGTNGSGKHVNWSLSTDTGINLLEYGKSSLEHARFLLFLVAIIKAVDDHQDLLRLSAASAGNDHRLGSNEAPPAIISIFLGNELTHILKTIESGADFESAHIAPMELGVTSLPHFAKDATDRNRTSPFAFTGNKFEFRMLGSAFSIAGPNIIINTVVAESLKSFADALENSHDFSNDLTNLIQKNIAAHKKILFNGNSYAKEWVTEAENRGLLNLKTSVDARPFFISKENVELFTEHGVYSQTEMFSRYEIQMENYCNHIHIEAATMVTMVKREIIPACIQYEQELTQVLGCKNVHDTLNCTLEIHLLSTISDLSDCLLKKLTALEDSLLNCKEHHAVLNRAQFYCHDVLAAMAELRFVVDELETIVAKDHWPLPSYTELLYSVE